MEGLIFKQRDKYSIELKLRHVMGGRSKERKSGYRLGLYFFLPQSFHINPETYDRDTFYDDTKLYIRFNTPYFAVTDLLDSESDRSPLIRAEQMVRDAAEGRALPADRFFYETKMLGAVYKSMLRESIRRLRREMPDTDVGSYVEKPATAAARELHKVAVRFHDLTRQVEELEALSELRTHTRMIDEHLSLLFERYLTAFLDQCEYDEGDNSAYNKIARILVKEIQYRGQVDYPTSEPNPDVEQQMEEYVYREKMLKRYVSEVLFFRVKKTDEAKRAEHLLYALAAGIAMVFATAIAFYGQTAFGNITTSLFVLLVVSYMLKDRMKDFFRDLFSRSIGGRFPDRRESLYDAIQGRKLAVVKERVAFVPERKLSPEVRTARNRGEFEEALFATAGERVLHYRKDVSLKSKTLRKTHYRVRGIADISIVNLESFLRHLAVQYGRIPLALGKKKVSIVGVKRIYHLNVVIVYESEEGRSGLRRFRLVVDAKGIKRVEEVPREPGSGPIPGAGKLS
ncbi:MAG: hypothetical protein ACLFPV_11210 [Spirochaetaceae bacterium]